MAKNSLLNYEEPHQFSVTEISNKVKWLLENNLGYVKIKGEISGLKIAASGHGYFSLKDQNAVLAATCWRHNLAKINFKLEEGLEVVVSGKITAYAGQSKYQISVENIEPAGAGAFMQILKERKAKLEKEGLFAKEHKKPIPYFPKKIGIITSETGAVIRDIIHRISDRCPAHLVVWPVTVQGDTAASEVSKAIDGFNNLSEQDKPDLLIVARGGGSIEDLWPFNDEIVVRSTYNSKIPLISAVGHETDYTLIDFAADKRAPTPTAAAEFAVPVILDLRYTLNSLWSTISNKLIQYLRHYSQLMQSYDRILQYPLNYIGTHIQRVDELGMRLAASLPSLLKIKSRTLSYLPIHRLAPLKQISMKQMKVSNLGNMLSNKQLASFSKYEHKLALNSGLLDSLDYRKVLARGYAMTRDKDGSYLSNTAELKKAGEFAVVMSDGEVKAVAK